MVALATQGTTKSKSLTILQRIAGKDKTAVTECVDAYGNFIWALAQKFTASREEAEAATQEIFIDIWRFAERNDQPQTTEKLLIALIARGRLVKYLKQNSGRKSMANIDKTNEQGQERAESPNNFEISSVTKVRV